MTCSKFLLTQPRRPKTMRLCGQLTGSVVTTELKVSAARPGAITSWLIWPTLGKEVAGPKPPPGGLVSTFRVRVVPSVQARTKVPAESATTRPPQKFDTESPGADSRAGGPQEPPAGSFEAYSATMEVFGTYCSKVATASPAPSIATLRFPASLADS